MKTNHELFELIKNIDNKKLIAYKLNPLTLKIHAQGGDSLELLFK